MLRAGSGDIPIATEPTILIADDQPALRRLVRVILTDLPYRLCEAADGDEAWAILQTQRAAVAILDVHMPGLNGFALTRAIRANPALAHTRVILLTGLLGPDAIATGRAAGADYYMTKPFSPRELVATIAACLAAPSQRACWE